MCATGLLPSGGPEGRRTISPKPEQGRAGAPTRRDAKGTRKKKIKRSHAPRVLQTPSASRPAESARVEETARIYGAVIGSWQAGAWTRAREREMKRQRA